MVHLAIEDENVAKLRSMTNIEPTFQIIHKGKIYPCNPIPAVESAHIVFEGYSSAKAIGYMELVYEDKKNLLQSVISFLHGKSLIINPENAQELLEISAELGIPSICDHASNCLLVSPTPKPYEKEID